MSSYTIDKQEYIKLAGLLYGHEAKKKHCDIHRWYLERIREQMERCYILNLASVNKQYHDHEKADKNTYDEVFEEYVNLGKRIKDKELLKIARDFFACADYQTDDRKFSKEMHDWFFIVLKRLLPAGEGWGEINVDESQLNEPYESILDMVILR